MKKIIILSVTLISLFLCSLNAFAATAFGDLNEDGKVTTTDVSIIDRHVLGIKAIISTLTSVADVNGDKIITSTDSALILRKVLGSIKIFPVESIKRLKDPYFGDVELESYQATVNVIVEANDLTLTQGAYIVDTSIYKINDKGEEVFLEKKSSEVSNPQTIKLVFGNLTESTKYICKLNLNSVEVATKSFETPKAKVQRTPKFGSFLIRENKAIIDVVDTSDDMSKLPVDNVVTVSIYKIDWLGREMFVSQQSSIQPIYSHTIKFEFDINIESKTIYLCKLNVNSIEVEKQYFDYNELKISPL